MGMYTAMLEAELNSVQDPDNPGVDLDQVEKDVCGPEGIESHSEEIEDANSGVVGDPLEEAYMALYESEYNYNLLMQAIGFHELSCMQGGDMVMSEEGKFDKVKANVSGFFKKIKEMLVNAFKKITEAFRTVLAKVMNAAKGDKKFATQYKDRIQDGYNKEWKTKGFKYTGEEIKFDNARDTYMHDFEQDCAKGFDNPRQIDKKGIMKDHAGVDCENPGQLSKKLLAKMRGSEDRIELNKSNIDLQRDVLAILNGGADISSIKQRYAGIKTSYKEAIQRVAAMEQKATRSDTGNNSGLMAVCTYYGNMVRFGQNVENIKYVCAIKIAKERRSQARRLASMFAGTSDAKQAKNESARLASRIADVQLI